MHVSHQGARASLPTPSVTVVIQVVRGRTPSIQIQICRQNCVHLVSSLSRPTHGRTHRSGKLPRDVRQRRPRGRARGFHPALATSSFPIRRAFRTVGVRVHVFLVVKERELKLGAKRCAIVARGRVRPETTSERTGGSIDARGDEHDARRSRGGGFGDSEGVRL